MNTETLVPDELRGDLIKEAQITILQLRTTEVASQLTLDDFKVFASIQPTEYIDKLFNIKSKYGIPNLEKFVELVNKEMYWVITEVCSEPNVVKRMRIIKQFIKIAKHCKDCKNFNSMFSILSGLDKVYVSRLRNTWEKLSKKDLKTYDDLKELIDPSKNMSKYRSYVGSEHVQPPMLPLFPVAMKDLTFLKDGNDTKVDGLINFEKFRMIAKEIRHLCSMCSAKYDVNNMFLGPQSMIESSWIMGMATMKRVKNRRGSALPNAKKMYEEAQMVRRVKSYLSNIKVIYDEDKLREMSYQCEPDTKVRRVEHSPSVPNITIPKDDKAAAIPTGPKFGSQTSQSSLTSNESSSTDTTQVSQGSSHPQYARLSNNHHESPDSGRHSMISTAYDTQSTTSAGSSNSLSSHSPPPHFRRQGPQTEEEEQVSAV